MSWGPWVDLRYNDEDREDDLMNAPAGIAFGRQPKPQYPYGVKIQLSEKELRKMETSAREFKVGEIIDIRAMGSVTAVREEEGNCCVEIQLERIACENEDDEGPSDEPDDDDAEEQDK